MALTDTPTSHYITIQVVRFDNADRYYWDCSCGATAPGYVDTADTARVCACAHVPEYAS